MILITGGAGFVGVNLAHRLLSDGEDVLILDNLSRPTASLNLDWLRAEHGTRCRPLVADVRERDTLRRCLRQASFVYHFAAQVAVTTSLADPCHDYDVNLNGTLGLLEELRLLHKPPGMLFTSTNKVYGALRDVPLHLHWNRYEPDNLTVARCGISEAQRHDWPCLSGQYCPGGTVHPVPAFLNRSSTEPSPEPLPVASSPEPSVECFMHENITPAGPPRTVLDEARSLALVAALGVPVVEHAVLRAPPWTHAIAWPVAAKLLSADLPHKTEAGAVTLRVPDATSCCS